MSWEHGPISDKNLAINISVKFVPETLVNEVRAYSYKYVVLLLTNETILAVV